MSIACKPKEDTDRRHILGPKSHLALFCWCQIIVYFDRGVVSGMLSHISDEVPGAESKFVAGFLGGMFMLGYMIASPLFVRLSQQSRDWTVYAIVLGMAILAGSAVLTYFLSTSFAGLLVARLLSGAGEAAFCSLAPPIIDESAPVGKKSLYVGLYFTFLYVGFGMGSAACFVFDTWNSGRILFLIEAGLVVPCVVVLLALRKRLSVPDSIHEDTARSANGGGLWAQLKVILSQPVFLLLSLGYGAFFFAFGAFAFWTPTVMKELYPESANLATLAFGGVTILTGVIGTAAGGIMMDYLSRRLSSHKRFAGYPDETIRVLSGVAICVVLCLLGMLFTFPTSFSSSIYVFLVFFAMGTLLLFSMTAPINIAIMYSVPAALKAQAMAVSTGLSHMIGDFPSPFAIGAIIDASGYKTAMLVTSGILLAPAALWFGAGVVAKREGDAYETKPEVANSA